MSKNYLGIILLLLSLAALPAQAADVSFVAKATATAGLANTLTVNSPTGTTTGDLLVIIGTRNAVASGDSLVDDNGSTPFTKVREDHELDNGSQLVIFRRVIQSGDPTSWKFNFSGDTGMTRISLLAATFRDQHADLFDVLPSGSTVTKEGNDSGDLVCNGNTTTVDNSIHVLVAGREAGDGTGYNGIPAGYTLLQAWGFANQPQTTAYKVIAVAGATGSQTFTGSGNASGICQSFTIKNNTGGGGGGGGGGGEGEPPPEPESGAIQIRQSVSCAGAADWYVHCTLPSPPLAGNKLVLLVSMQQYPWISSCSVSTQMHDPHGNNQYLLGVEGPVQNNSQSSIWLRDVLTSGSGTWTVSVQCYPNDPNDPADTSIALTVMELTGVVASYAAFESPGWTGVPNPSSVTVTSFQQTTQANVLAVAVLTMKAPSVAITTQSGWTELRNNGNPTTYVVGAAAFSILSSVQSPSHTWGTPITGGSGSDHAQAVIGAFKGVLTGGGTVENPSSINRTLQWTDNATNETGYRVEKRTDQSFPTWVSVASGLSANTTTYTAQILSTETGDCWRVFATNPYGEQVSNVACGNAPNVEPPPPLPPPPPVIQIGGLQSLMDDELL
jgi:hypothetical protein